MQRRMSDDQSLGSNTCFHGFKSVRALSSVASHIVRATVNF